MALWIQNITPDRRSDDELHLYKVAVNNDQPLAYFEHRRRDGAAACLRAAADAIELANTAPKETTR